jgi:hypothetical protein
VRIASRGLQAGATPAITTACGGFYTISARVTEHQSRTSDTVAASFVRRACSAIRPGDLEYDVVTTTAELRLDALCYAVFTDVQGTTPGAAAP